MPMRHPQLGLTPGDPDSRRSFDSQISSTGSQLHLSQQQRPGHNGRVPLSHTHSARPPSSLIAGRRPASLVIPNTHKQSMSGNVSFPPPQNDTLSNGPPQCLTPCQRGTVSLSSPATGGGAPFASSSSTQRPAPLLGPLSQPYFSSVGDVPVAPPSNTSFRSPASGAARGNVKGSGTAFDLPRPLSMQQPGSGGTPQSWMHPQQSPFSWGLSPQANSPFFQHQQRQPLLPPPPHPQPGPSASWSGAMNAPHGAPGHLEWDCAQCAALIESVYAASRETAEEEMRRRSELEAKRQQQASREEEELQRALRESLALDAEQRRRKEEAGAERVALEESLRTALQEQETESLRREAEVQTTAAALARSREQASDDARRRRSREELEQAIEARVMGESKREQELEWHRREEEERMFLQALKDESQGQASVWERMQRDDAFKPAFDAHRRHSMKIGRKSGRHGNATGTDSGSQSGTTSGGGSSIGQQGHGPLSREPEVGAEPLDELASPSMPSASDLTLGSSGPATPGDLGIALNPFTDAAEAPPLYEDVTPSPSSLHSALGVVSDSTAASIALAAPERPPLSSRSSEPRPLASMFAVLSVSPGPSLSSSPSTLHRHLPQSTPHPHSQAQAEISPLPSSMPQIPPKLPAMRQSLNGMHSRPLPRIPQSLVPALSVALSPAAVSLQHAELDSFERIIGDRDPLPTPPPPVPPPPPLPLSMPRLRSESMPSAPVAQAATLQARNLSPLPSVRTTAIEDLDSDEEENRALSSRQSQSTCSRSASIVSGASGQYNGNAGASLLSLASNIALGSGSHGQEQGLEVQSLDTKFYIPRAHVASQQSLRTVASEISHTSISRPQSTSSAAGISGACASIPRFEQKTPESVDWGYASSPFDTKLYASPQSMTVSESKQYFPTVITLRAHDGNPDARAARAAPAQTYYFVIRAQTWKALLRAMAWFGNTRIEAGPEEVVEAATSAATAESKAGPGVQEARPLTDAGACKLMIDLEFVTPQRWDVSLAPIVPEGTHGVQGSNGNDKPAFVAVCLSLVQHRSAEVSSVLAFNNRKLDTMYLQHGSARRAVILPQRPPPLPISVVDLAQRMHGAHAFSAACPSISSSSNMAASPRDLHNAIEKHDVKFFGKRRKEAGNKGQGGSRAHLTVSDDPTGMHIAATGAVSERTALERMKGAVKKLAKRRDDHELNEDLSTWITPFDLSEYG
ncbi:hypothetical protein K437DRAFT_265578 [Tilletiaria anomala UBC 951]|uniref:Uncharacterized protein n=1 Tax=Tilletiaria anomala (strain ATCC 24038 / CBS 436.72 / UBC 951) TaxID=1037660 RepID=A0A066WI54_TILAU|nr:uncharacterized protein K437DRAFT_265578 [Tilletiaria anomala UBC 951]KDN53511.1 hypothetical protein K437DRAFT_265578 [Tilletiaria anomala UBC 951]